MKQDILVKLLSILTIIVGINMKQESQAEYIPPGACWRWIEDAEGTTRGCMPDPSPKSKNIDICKIIKSVTETCHGERRGGGGGSSSGKTMPSPKQSAPKLTINEVKAQAYLVFLEALEKNKLLQYTPKANELDVESNKFGGKICKVTFSTPPISDLSNNRVIISIAFDPHKEFVPPEYLPLALGFGYLRKDFTNLKDSANWAKSVGITSNNLIHNDYTTIDLSDMLRSLKDGGLYDKNEKLFNDTLRQMMDIGAGNCSATKI